MTRTEKLDLKIDSDAAELLRTVQGFERRKADMIRDGSDITTVQSAHPVAVNGPRIDRHRGTVRTIGPTKARPDDAEIGIRLVVFMTNPPGPRSVRNHLNHEISPDQTARSTIIFLISPIARAGERPLGQTFEQFMMVWQR